MIIDEKLLNSKEGLIGKFLIESNLIENEDSREATEDALLAWKYVEGLDQIATKDVLEIHRILMKRLRKDIAGKWRNCEVYIGGFRKDNLGPVVFENKVQEALVWVNAPHNHDNEEYARRCHVMFENIHPFEDGNGRVGRILYNWQRLKLDLPVHVIHADYFEKHDAGEQWEYYQWFKNEQ